MPLISVILTSFNHGNFIRETIDSILNQSFHDFELIIWDDASIDNSWEVIESYRDSRIRSFRNPQNKGPVFGVNKAIFEIAQGKYVAIHHSDDVWELNKLQIQVDFLEANSGVGAVFSNAQAIDEGGAPLTDSTHFYYNIFSQPNRSRYEWLRYFFLTGNALCHPSILIRKQCYVDCGPYLDMLAQVPDFDMWVRLSAKYEIHVLPDRLVRFRVRDGEMNSSGNRPMTRIRGAYEFYKVLQRYRSIVSVENVFKIFPEFLSYDRGEKTDPEYVLARVCLESKSFFLRHLLANEILFEMLNNPARRALIESAYHFSPNDFIGITGKHDLFSREEVLSLQISMVERERNLLEEYLGRERNLVEEHSQQLDTILQSYSWQITAPLRWVRVSLQTIRRWITKNWFDKNTWRALFGCNKREQPAATPAANVVVTIPARTTEVTLSGAKFVSGISPELAGLEFRDGKSCHLDTIDGKSPDEVKALTRSSNILFQGWAFDEESKIAPKVVALQFAGKNGKYHVLANRYPRPDVTEALGSKEGMDAGLEVRADLTSLPAGSYEILIAQRLDKSISVCHTSRMIELK